MHRGRREARCLAKRRDLNAYDLLLRAQQLRYEFTEDAFAAAIQCLHQALAIDPAYAPAMALAAYCYAERRLQGWPQDPEAEAVVGHRLATRAVDLARDANVLWTAASGIRVLGKDPGRAGELSRLSLQLNPNSVMALTAAAWNEASFGNPAETLKLLDRAERISPRDPRAWFMASARAHAHLAGDQYNEAASWAKKGFGAKPSVHARAAHSCHEPGGAGRAGQGRRGDAGGSRH